MNKGSNLPRRPSGCPHQECPVNDFRKESKLIAKISSVLSRRLQSLRSQGDLRIDRRQCNLRFISPAVAQARPVESPAWPGVPRPCQSAAPAGPPAGAVVVPAGCHRLAITPYRTCASQFKPVASQLGTGVRLSRIRFPPITSYGSP
jgi:hypothetical protein